jgi:hypothetical protein
MGKKLMSVEVKGKHSRWGFEFYGDPAYLEEWRADGLEVYEIVNTIPVWVVRWGLTLPWCFMQDLFNFKFGELRYYFRAPKKD